MSYLSELVKVTNGFLNLTLSKMPYHNILLLEIFPKMIIIVSVEMSNQHQSDERKVVATNRKASYDFFIEETLEAGIALKGTEVKSLRDNLANLQDSYATIRNGELWLIGLHINHFNKGNINNHDPVRERRLLVHKREIRKLQTKVVEKGLTLIPMSIYFVKNIVKIEVAIARGKKSYDKRESIAKRDAEREMRRKEF